MPDSVPWHHRCELTWASNAPMWGGDIHPTDIDQKETFQTIPDAVEFALGLTPAQLKTASLVVEPAADHGADAVHYHGTRITDLKLHPGYPHRG